MRKIILRLQFTMQTLCLSCCSRSETRWPRLKPCSRWFQVFRFKKRIKAVKKLFTTLNIKVDILRSQYIIWEPGSDFKIENTFWLIAISHLQMKRASRYRLGVDQHIQAMLSHSSRHELCSEDARTRRRDGGGDGRAVRTCARSPLSSPPRPNFYPKLL